MNVTNLEEAIGASLAVLEWLQAEDRKAAVNPENDFFHSSSLADAAQKQRDALRFMVTLRRIETKKQQS